MEKVFFNGSELTKHITVARGFTLSIGADFEPKLNSYEISSGAEFAYTRKKEKVIPIPFYNKTGSFDEYNELEKILNVNGPKELKFSSWPNKIFYAIPTGTLDFTSLARANGKGTLSFVVVDGMAHSTTETDFQFSKNANGIWEATVINNGSEPVSVDYQIELAKESGFLGIASPYGGMQFGKKEEADGVTEVKNVTLLSNKSGNFGNWTDATVFHENQTKKSVTTMTADTQSGGRLGILPSSFTNTAGGAQFGAIKEHTLSQSAKSWYLWAKAWFETGQIDQTGAWCLSVVDTNNQFLAGMAIEKTNLVSNQATVHFLLGDGAGGSRAVHSINFSPSKSIPPNPYGEDSKNSNRNMFDIRKVGNKVTFFWYGEYHSFAEARIQNLEAKKIQFFVGQYSGRPSSKMITRTYLNDLTFQKLGVEVWRNVPNRYPANAVLEIDGGLGKFYVNNKIEMYDEIMGTKFFKAPPGETKIQLLVSSFSEIKNAKATIKEVYI